MNAIETLSEMHRALCLAHSIAHYRLRSDYTVALHELQKKVGEAIDECSFQINCEHEHAVTHPRK